MDELRAIYETTSMIALEAGFRAAGFAEERLPPSRRRDRSA